VVWGAGRALSAGPRSMMHAMHRSRLTADVTLPREPKQERSRRKQTALMESAASLFADPGFEHVTADEIAAHAGYGTGTFYNYFTNKTQAFLMVAGQHETAIAPTLAAVTSHLTAGAPLQEVAAAIVSSVIADRQRVPWLRKTWLRLALTDPEVDAVQRRLDAEWDEALAGVIADVMADRDITLPGASPLAMATTVRVLVDAVADEVVLAGTISAEEAAAAASALIVGLVPER
jgi:AcrR family transcriptional regulator